MATETTKIFIGYLINSSLRLHLDNSPERKQELITKETSALVEVNFKTKSYIGLFTSEEKTSMKNIKDLQNKIKDKLQLYCPELNLESMVAHVFPQTFIG